MAAAAIAAVPSAALSVDPWKVEKTLTNADAPGGTLGSWRIVPDPNGSVVYLSTNSGPKVFTLDPTTNVITGSISLPGGSLSAQMAIDPAGRHLYVRPGWNANTVYKIDTATRTSVGSFALNQSGTFRTFAASDSTVYTLEQGEPRIYTTNATTNQTAVIPLTGGRMQQPMGLAFSPDGAYLYIPYSNLSGSDPARTGVVKVDLRNPATQTNFIISDTQNMNVGSIQVSRDGRTLYVWNEDLADLYVMDAATGLVTKTIDAGTSCGSPNCGAGSDTYLALSPTGDYVIATVASGAQRMWMIDLTSDAVTPLGAAQGFSYPGVYTPDFVAFGPVTACRSQFYVDNYVWGTPSVIDIARAIAGPCAPTGVTVTPGVEKLDVSFTAPSDDGGSPITGYEYSIDGGTTWKSTGSTGTSFSITGLKAGTTYTVMVRGINAAAPGAVGTEAKGTPTAPEKKQDQAAAASPKIALPAATVTRGATLTSVVNPSTAGTVKVTATLRGRTVCTATKKATKAGRMTVTCALGPAARAAIRLRPVTLTVTARLTDAAGKTASATRTVKVARYRVRTPVTG
jgi:hypothetical protein